MSKFQVGVNYSEIIRRVARNAQLANQEAERKQKEEDSRWRYEADETYYCLVQLVSPDRESAQKVYEASTVAEVPGIGLVKGRGHTPDSALLDVRYRLAQEWTRRRLVKDYDTARERAAKVRLEKELFL